MEKTNLTCNEMVVKFENAVYDKRSICVYIKGKFSKSTYMIDLLEVANYEETICFKEAFGLGLECSLQKNGIKDIYTTGDDMGETVGIRLDNEIEIDFMIV